MYHIGLLHSRPLLEYLTQEAFVKQIEVENKKSKELKLTVLGEYYSESEMKELKGLSQYLILCYPLSQPVLVPSACSESGSGSTKSRSLLRPILAL